MRKAVGLAEGKRIVRLEFVERIAGHRKLELCPAAARQECRAPAKRRTGSRASHEFTSCHLPSPVLRKMPRPRRARPARRGIRACRAPERRRSPPPSGGKPRSSRAETASGRPPRTARARRRRPRRGRTFRRDARDGGRANRRASAARLAGEAPQIPCLRG